MPSTTSPPPGVIWRYSSPGWLKEWQAAKGTVVVNGKKLPLWSLRLRKDDVLRIPGNADQGKAVKAALNFILFTRLGE